MWLDRQSSALCFLICFSYFATSVLGVNNEDTGGKEGYLLPHPWMWNLKKNEENTPQKSPKNHLYQSSWRLNNIYVWKKGGQKWSRESGNLSPM